MCARRIPLGVNASPIGQSERPSSAADSGDAQAQRRRKRSATTVHHPLPSGDIMPNCNAQVPPIPFSPATSPWPSTANRPPAAKPASNSRCRAMPGFPRTAAPSDGRPFTARRLRGERGAANRHGRRDAQYSTVDTSSATAGEARTITGVRGNSSAPKSPRSPAAQACWYRSSGESAMPRLSFRGVEYLGVEIPSRRWCSRRWRPCCSRRARTRLSRRLPRSKGVRRRMLQVARRQAHRISRPPPSRRGSSCTPSP